MYTTYYTVKPEFFSLWGEDVNEETIITENELEDLSNEWDKPTSELETQLYKHERQGISIDNGIHYTTPEKALERIPLSVMVEYMEDEARELASRYAPCSDLFFLYTYLGLAPADLIIG